MEDKEDWEEFLKAVMSVVPSDGGTKAYYVLKLFESIVNSDIVFN
jgi:hypothetical protein